VHALKTAMRFARIGYHDHDGVLVDTEARAALVDATYVNYQPHVRRPFGVLGWPALLRKLDRIDPGFRE
jgi:hypothetical protein